MPCDPVRLRDGTMAIVCSRGSRRRPAHCDFCGEPHEKLCDFRLPSGRTCDKKLCRQHATHRAPNWDYCPEHKNAPHQGQLEILAVV